MTYLTLFKFDNEAAAQTHPIVGQWWNGTSWNTSETVPGASVSVATGVDADGNPTFVTMPYWYIQVGGYDVIPEWQADPACMLIVDIEGPNKGLSKDEYITYLADPLLKEDMLVKYIVSPMPW